MNGWVKRRTSLVLCAVIVVSVAGSNVGLAAATPDGNSAPLADAGLDRDVSVNGTVYLDATGSYDPDGTITSYEWEIEKPDGTHADPVCGSCARTEFVAREPGTYNVTVTVTDGDGARRSDTLRVNASTVEGPSVEVDGPTTVVANRTVNFTATLTAGDRPLSRVDWHVGDGLEARQNLDGASATVELNVTLDAGSHTVEVEVYDEFGRTATTTLNVSVVEPVVSRGERSSETSGGNGNEEVACSRHGLSSDYYCENDMLVRQGSEHDITLIDVSNDGNITWNGKKIDTEKLKDHPGVDVGSTGGKIRFESREAYEEVTGTLSLNPNTNYGSAIGSDTDNKWWDGTEKSSESDSKSNGSTDNKGSGSSSGGSSSDPKRGSPAILNRHQGFDDI